MKIVNAKFLFFLIGYAYLNFISDATSSLLKNIFQNSTDCIFGVKHVSTILYTSKNPYGKNIEVQEVCNNAKPSQRFVFLVHGFLSSPNHTDSYELTVQFLKKNYTVFSVDWSDAACKNGIPLLQLLEYPNAVNNTREVGERMAEYVIELMTKCKVPKENIIFVGHSLGAHVSGFAAKKIQKDLEVNISRIIGADPAGPLFIFNGCSKRLCKSDADSVNIFHTSSLGIPYSIGRFDFWFNSGVRQPGCVLDITSSCSHSRSISYQTCMLEWDCGFPGVPKKHFLCPNSLSSETTDCIVLNSKIYEKDYMEDGNYCVFVEKNYPYCTNNTFNCQK